MAQANLHSDWVAGISIGPINAALIAGNLPDVRGEKLRRFRASITGRPALKAIASVESTIAKGMMREHF